MVLFVRYCALGVLATAGIDQRLAARVDERQKARPMTTTTRFPRTVTCVWCGNRYGSAVPIDLCRGTQGCGCASDVSLRDGVWLVVCGYGSENDRDVFRFVANEPTATADPICDECIRERLCCGDLVRLGEYLIGEDFTATLDHLLRKPTP